MISSLAFTPAIKTQLPSQSVQAQNEITPFNDDLEKHFREKFSIQTSLNRQLVSFQANKTRPIYRWYKYKEAFSAALVEHLLKNQGISKGVILDPFAGSGTALFAASELGISADGIELLPIGQRIIQTRLIIDNEFAESDLERLKYWVKEKTWNSSYEIVEISELRITKGAYPVDSLEKIQKYLGAVAKEAAQIQAVLRFALLCVLEDVSYTRKDGQYLRWDYRSNRKQGDNPFNKGEILDFDKAISKKLDEIVGDLTVSPAQPALFQNDKPQRGKIHLIDGSSLNVMPELKSNYYDAIVTSPPYCNRYDYTRTYALELALLGVDESGLTKFRQEMLSCTVENRAKNLLGINPAWQQAISACDEHSLLQAILKYLKKEGESGNLNNSGIPRMVRGYFYEMACVIYESHRILKSGGLMMMANDNVRYAGISISVDMILSSIAERLGFCVENIMTLPNGKGNSSQQMGEHGREQLRKCVYIWRKC